MDEGYREIAKTCRPDDYTVRIETKYGMGTGFLYAVTEEYVYFLSACHVILKAFVRRAEGDAIRMDYRGDSRDYALLQFELCTLYEEDELTEERCDQLEDDGDRNRDIAAFRIKRADFVQGNAGFPEKIDRLSEEKIVRDLKYAGAGFPDEKKYYEELWGDCLGWDAESRLLVCKARNIHAERFDDVMRGFSGTGLIALYRDSPVFIGIVVSCRNEEEYGHFRVVGSTQISERLKRAGWETMEEYAEGLPPEGFYRGGMMGLQDQNFDELQAMSRNLIRAQLRQIDRKYMPQGMLAGEPFYDIPVCDGNRKKCKHYWCGRAWPLLAGKILHGDAGEAYYISEDGRRLSIEYICSEGNGQADLSSVVSAAASHKILGEQIPGDAILIWQSRERPGTKRFFPRKRFQRIIKDIAEGESSRYKNYDREAAYDLLDGELKEKDYGIIHVRELADRLDDCGTEEELKEKMEAVFHEIWG